jgi:signal transduction histidine kinase
MDLDILKQVVLIVGQDRDHLKGVKTFFKKQGYRVITASSGKRVLEKAFLEKPRFVLLDSLVPDIPPGELIRRIKEIDPKISIIAAASPTIEGAVDLKEYGVDHFVKPADHSQIVTILKKAGNHPDFEEGKKWGMDSLLEKFLPFWAHEIRNPLQAIGGAMTIIERRSNSEDKTLAQSINIVKEEVQTLTDFVQECLDYIKPPNRSHWGEININETIILVLNLMPLLVKGLYEKVSITTHFDPSLPKVYANYEEIKKVILNIIKNAFESMSTTEKKELTIQTGPTAERNNEWVEILIKDSGEGIKKEHVQSIGTPFFTTKLRGTGMGLVICNRIIVERHNGRLSLEGEENKGTTATIHLPVNPEHVVVGG